MKAILLCAGYATRLYPLTKNQPKALLPIKNKPLINYIAEKIEKCEEIDEIFIITNEKFYMNFVWWLKNNNEKFSKKIEILNDNTISNEDRLGGIGDLWYAVEKKKINDDIMVVLGDNLFTFDLNKIIDFFSEKKATVLGLYDVKNLEDAKRFGIVSIDENNKIIDFQEKPENPKSTLASIGIYFYTKEDLKQLEKYMKTDNQKDCPGYFPEYLRKNQNIYAIKLDGIWFDIGTKQSYEEVNKIWNGAN